jgi:hypothetical protein
MRKQDEMASHINFNELKVKGWTSLQSDADQPTLLRIAEILGTIVPAKAGGPLFSDLTPNEDSKGRKSFSGRFGKGKFPMHTDTAHWSKPARYLLLCDAGKMHGRPTLVVHGTAACFSISASEKYLESFLNLGTANVQSAINDIGALTPSDVEDENAEYYFNQVIGGQTITFPVEFVKENGVWKILEF